MYSAVHELEYIEVQPDQWQVIQQKGSTWLLILTLVFVASLVGALGYVVRRQRRISNSFSRFTNSHYDTKNGVRIGGAMEEDDQHHNVDMNLDVPRFDDDEPLVLR